MPQTGLFSSPRHLAEQELEEKKENTKKLQPEELQKSVARLTVMKERVQETGPLGKAIVMGKGQLDSSVNRLYKEAVDRKKKVMHDLELKTSPTGERNVMDRDVLDGSVERIYNQALQHKKELSEKLRAKHVTNPGPQKKLTKEHQQACNERAYTGPMQKKKESEEKLVDKYITSTTTKFRKMNKQEWQDTVSRLCK
eukprot:TRINITY_DN4581_c2_g1_i1.p1 TRINITY_DN4581_c2_g1~~TRINITY_DN4581_c2_g1_i1.p1  ORF type:complete len:209 (+),score=64.95 TRINITY_DN4581_c2_g1_i1:37-627(+)